MNRKLLTAALSGTLVLPMAAQAVDFSVSGHVGRAIVVMDDGSGGNDVGNQDTWASPSRFRMTGSEDLDAGVTAGFSLEYGAGNDANANPNLRQGNVYLSGGFGKLTIGQQSRATDGSTYSNFDNHAWLGTEIGCDYCGAGSAVFATIYNGGRGEGVRYDTPGLGPATVAISSDGSDRWDAAINVAGDAGVGGYELKAGFTDNDGMRTNTIAGAVALAQGAHFNAAWGKSDADESDYLHFGVGYNAADTSVAATYSASDIDGGGNSWAIGVGQGMGAGVQLFAGYKQLDFDDEMMEDYGLFVIGSRISFN
jgi:predicted porin